MVKTILTSSEVGDAGLTLILKTRDRDDCSLVFFDAVPGGAGHVRYMRKNLELLSRSALSLVRNCTCGVDSSCYSCLRSYDNEFHHDQLRHCDVQNFLEKLVAGS